MVSVPVPMTDPPTTMLATSPEVKEPVGFRTYKTSKTCRRTDWDSGRCEIPACGGGDVDMGTSRTGHLPLPRRPLRPGMYNVG